MRRMLCMLLGLALAGTAGAQAYRWVDKDGRVHYGDKPPAGAASRAVQNKISSISGPAVVSAAPAGVARGAVALYSTSWCRYCALARKHFAARGVAFEERDIEKSPTWKREYDALGGRGVPVILVGRSRMDGYQSGQLDAMLKKEGY